MGSNGPHAFPCPWRETPLVESASLSDAAGCRVFLKLENLQPSGSFKSRGIGNLIRRAILESPPAAPLHFYSTSAGNAGLACVIAATRYGYPSTVTLPTTAKDLVVRKLYEAGATNVIQYGNSWFEANQWMVDNLLANDPNGVYVPPFDHQHIVEGNETLVPELYSQLYGEEPDAIVCSVGGGGMFAGLMDGFEKYKWSHTKVVLIETAGADSLDNSLKKGANTTLPSITSIATTLGVSRVSQKAFEYAHRKNVANAVIPDGHAALACVNFAKDERMLVEPACGAALAPCYNGLLNQLVPGLNPESKVVIIVCGGSSINLELLEGYSRTYSEFATEMVGQKPPVIARLATLVSPIEGPMKVMAC